MAEVEATETATETETLQNIIESYVSLQNYIIHSPGESTVGLEIKKCANLEDVETIEVKHQKILAYMKETQTITQTFKFEKPSDVRVAVVYGLRICNMSCEDIKNKCRSAFPDQKGGLSRPPQNPKMQMQMQMQIQMQIQTPPTDYEKALTDNINFFCRK